MSAVEVAQKRPEGAGTFMVTVGQAGLVIAGLGGGGYAVGGIAGAVASLTITPAILARALTKPEFTNLLANGLHMKPTHKEYAVSLAKIANLLGLSIFSID